MKTLSETIRTMGLQEQDPALDPQNDGEYNDEGGMAITQLKTARDAVDELMTIIKDDDNLPEWVQSKLTKAVDYMDSVRDYLSAEFKEAIDPADVDDDATADDIKNAAKNIIVQLRKASDVKGNRAITFADGKSKKIKPDVIDKLLKIFMQIKKPRDKEKFQAMIAKSERDMMNIAKKLGAQYNAEELDEAYQKSQGFNNVDNAINLLSQMLDPRGALAKNISKGADNVSGEFKKMQRAMQEIEKQWNEVNMIIGQNESVQEETDMNEAMDQKKFASAEKELVKYAMKDGGIDKKDFLAVAKMLGQIGRINILQAGQVLAQLNKKLKGMDTDPRDKVYEILKGQGLMEMIEALDKDDEPKIKEIIKKLKGASQAHAGQAKDLEKAVNEDYYTVVYYDEKGRADGEKNFKDKKKADAMAAKGNAVNKLGGKSGYKVFKVKGSMEEVEMEENFSPKEIKMAIGVASDKRYAGGNMTGAVKAIEKIKKGLSKHKQVAAVLQRQNEDVDYDQMFEEAFMDLDDTIRSIVLGEAKKGELDEISPELAKRAFDARAKRHKAKMGSAAGWDKRADKDKAKGDMDGARAARSIARDKEREAGDMEKKLDRSARKAGVDAQDRYNKATDDRSPNEKYRDYKKKGGDLSFQDYKKKYLKQDFDPIESLNAAILEVVLGEAQSGDKEAYQKFFKAAMKKFGIKSPGELSGDKEKEFYDYIDKNWKGDNEKAESAENGEDDHSEVGKSGKKMKVKVDPEIEEAVEIVAEDYDISDLTEEQLDELIGKIAKGLGKVAKKAGSAAVSGVKKAANRMSTSGRADAADKKAASLEKKKADRERLQRAKERLQKAKDNLNNSFFKEAEMTDAQMKKREEIVKELKKKEADFKERYGDRAKEVMYATATKMAMKS